MPSDFRIGLSREGPFFYPDLSVFSGEVELLDRHQDCGMNPAVMIEVMSPKTARYDRQTKAEWYRTAATVQHVVLISDYRKQVEHHFRSAGGAWQTEALTDGKAVLRLPAIEASLTLDEIYA